MDKRLDNEDWYHIFEHYSKPTHVLTRTERKNIYSRDDIDEVLYLVDGWNDGDAWIGVFKMVDGKYMNIRAYCDYTGWGCQEGGSSDYGDTIDHVIHFGLTLEERGILGLKING